MVISWRNEDCGHHWEDIRPPTSSNSSLSPSSCSALPAVVFTPSIPTIKLTASQTFLTANWWALTERCPQFPPSPYLIHAHTCTHAHTLTPFFSLFVPTINHMEDLVCGPWQPGRNRDENTHTCANTLSCTKHMQNNWRPHTHKCKSKNQGAPTNTHTESANSELELRNPSGKSHFPEHFTQFALLLASSLSPRRGDGNEEQVAGCVCVWVNLCFS